MAGYKHSQLKNKSFEEIQMLFDKEMKRVNLFLPMDSEVVERQKLEDNADKVELQLCLEIVLKDDEAVNIIRADGSENITRCVRSIQADTGITIHIMVERKYPLTQEMLSRMLSRRLEVDHECEMAYKLLRFTRSQLKK
ncbi:hypothetical protein Tco_1431870 [Tanacetum coccineum]